MKVNKPISVLYIHHSGYFGGASRSLLEMIEAFPDKEVEPFLLTQTGQVGAIFRERGIDVIKTVGTLSLIISDMATTALLDG